MSRLAIAEPMAEPTADHCVKGRLCTCFSTAANSKPRNCFRMVSGPGVRGAVIRGVRRGILIGKALGIGSTDKDVILGHPHGASCFEKVNHAVVDKVNDSVHPDAGVAAPEPPLEAGGRWKVWREIESRYSQELWRSEWLRGWQMRKDDLVRKGAPVEAFGHSTSIQRHRFGGANESSRGSLLSGVFKGDEIPGGRAIQGQWAPRLSHSDAAWSCGRCTLSLVMPLSTELLPVGKAIESSEATDAPAAEWAFTKSAWPGASAGRAGKQSIPFRLVVDDRPQWSDAIDDVESTGGGVVSRRRRDRQCCQRLPHGRNASEPIEQGRPQGEIISSTGKLMLSRDQRAGRLPAKGRVTKVGRRAHDSDS